MPLCAAPPHPSPIPYPYPLLLPCQCHSPCVGSPTVTCGGAWSNSVYAISSDKSLAPALTPSTAAFLPSSSPTPSHGSGQYPRTRRRELFSGEAEDPVLSIPPSMTASIVTRGTPRVKALETTLPAAALPIEVRKLGVNFYRRKKKT